MGLFSPATSTLEVGRLTIPGVGYGAAAKGTTAYIAGTLATDDVIYAINISDPANPAILSSVVTPSQVGHEMRILGNYVLAVGSSDFVVIAEEVAQVEEVKEFKVKKTRKPKAKKVK